jgi:hypothetical protein
MLERKGKIMNYNTREAILNYRARIDDNQQALCVPEESRALNTETYTLQELLKIACPTLEKDYEFYWRGFVLPEGPEFDAMLAMAAEDVRATREEGAPETNFEMYIQRVPAKSMQAGDESVAEEAERHEKEDASPERRREQARHMSRIRAASAWLLGKLKGL